MVNTDMVMRRLAKGLTTGAGVFASTFVGNALENRAGLSGLSVPLGQMVIGAGVAVGSDRLGEAVNMRTSRGNRSLFTTGVEHFGYGVHGAGFAEAAENIQSGQRADRVVTVNARSDEAAQRSADANADFSLDTG